MRLNFKISANMNSQIHLKKKRKPVTSMRGIQRNHNVIWKTNTPM